MSEPSLFELFDSDRDGLLTRDEAGHVIRAMGYCPSNKEVSAEAVNATIDQFEMRIIE